MFIVLQAYLVQCHVTHLPLGSLHQILHTFVYIGAHSQQSNSSIIQALIKYDNNKKSHAKVLIIPFK